MNGGAVSWSYKQDTTTNSITEAAYIAAYEAALKAIWIKKFVAKFRVVPPYLCYNRAVAQVKEPRSHRKS